MQVTPMQYHGPGWEAISEDGREFMVWAPRADEPHIINGTNYGPKAREQWQANWEKEDDVWSGDFAKADTLDDVLKIFPDDMAAAFREVITEYLSGERVPKWVLGGLVT